MVGVWDGEASRPADQGPVPEASRALELEVLDRSTARLARTRGEGSGALRAAVRGENEGRECGWPAGSG